MICERCSQQGHFEEKCEFCSRMVCLSCEKSSKRVRKTKRYVICKDCWGNLKSRQRFKAL